MNIPLLLVIKSASVIGFLTQHPGRPSAPCIGTLRSTLLHEPYGIRSNENSQMQTGTKQKLSFAATVAAKVESLLPGRNEEFYHTRGLPTRYCVTCFLLRLLIKINLCDESKMVQFSRCSGVFCFFFLSDILVRLC